ncbi:26S proteasome non-ATPase regulatory subunit 4 homolog isoform X2 [Juglans regia]|nr:26S proteasome non-ATPase regulatory subunit 4 homolog isoform X2 [Juglans regia]XP_018823773.1 26S proteasome non-ATPase regulatory subunit 4 homolog isoform X2 [Juglans regia]XP_018823774.1 26S proteasome non-ATPase regulatory subunit 4 homolog isoform X2 [Juglans regia]XP_018823775.1 26S proteasome non-ATPase regulatory subunit 4 homolog isoform X2 [Juglans regia]XP_035540501.1 26S proteasome non-ATPase regulatory subunit 4 homolog isoform X2 [Juglans regia]
MGDAEMTEAITDDREMALAREMSLQENVKTKLTESAESKLLGVDPNDPSVREMLASLGSMRHNKRRMKMSNQTWTSKDAITLLLLNL